MTNEGYSIRDRERLIEFSGTMLGSASSDTGNKVRWIEISIYMTEGGKYIVSGVGKTSVEYETDRPWAHVCTTAKGVIKVLTMSDKSGTEYLTNTARDAIDQCCMVDSDMRDAYYTETID